MRIYFSQNDSDLVGYNIIVHHKEVDDNGFVCSMLVEIGGGQNEKKYYLHLKKLISQWFYSLDQVSWKKVTQNNFSFISPLRSRNLPYWVQQNKISMVFDFIKKQKSEESSQEYLAKMPGKIIKILHTVGKAVKKGEVLLIMEAMKMENEIKAHDDGIIKSYEVVEGDHVKVGDDLVIMEKNSK